MKVNIRVYLLAGMMALGVMHAAARADSIQIQSLPVLSLNGIFTDFAYTVVLTPGNQLQNGDFFTLVDFTGYVGVASIAPTSGSWTLFSSLGVANTPVGSATPGAPAGTWNILTPAGGMSVPDDTLTPDLVFRYAGPTILAPAAGSVVTLGTFVITSTFDAIGGISTIVGADHQIGGQPGANADPYPVPGLGAPSAVPVPAAAWGGMSLLGVLGAGRAVRRRRGR